MDRTLIQHYRNFKMSNNKRSRLYHSSDVKRIWHEMLYNEDNWRTSFWFTRSKQNTTERHMKNQEKSMVSLQFKSNQTKKNKKTTKTVIYIHTKNEMAMKQNLMSCANQLKEEKAANWSEGHMEANREMKRMSEETDGWTIKRKEGDGSQWRQMPPGCTDVEQGWNRRYLWKWYCELPDSG